MDLESIAKSLLIMEQKYINAPMEGIGQLQERFDVVISSLAFHYVEDFEGVIKNVYNLLNDKGYLFSRKMDLLLKK